MTNFSPWIIRTLTLPPLLTYLMSRNSHRYHTPTIYLPQTATIPTYYGFSIAIPRYIAMQLSTFTFIMTRSTIVILLCMIM